MVVGPKVSGFGHTLFPRVCYSTLHSRTGPVEECAKGKKHFLVDAKPGKRRKGKGKVCVKEKEKRSVTHRLRYGSIGRE
jgi:hypothetical protein